MTSIDSAYHGWHRQLDNLRLPAKYHACSWCGLTADQWSYLRNSDSELSGYGASGVLREWAEDSRCYVPQCRSCHRKFDQAHRRVGRDALPVLAAELAQEAYAAVSPERRAVEDQSREASTRAALAFLAAQGKELGSRWCKPSRQSVNGANELMARAYANGPSGTTAEDMNASWQRWSAEF
ncbi:hypothetical protein [Streptomyces sp. WG-D5]